MKMKMIKQTLLAGIMLAWLPFVHAQEAGGEAGADDLQVIEANTLEELLDNVKDRRVVESRLHI